MSRSSLSMSPPKGYSEPNFPASRARDSVKDLFHLYVDGEHFTIQSKLLQEHSHRFKQMFINHPGMNQANFTNFNAKAINIVLGWLRRDDPVSIVRDLCDGILKDSSIPDLFEAYIVCIQFFVSNELQDLAMELIGRSYLMQLRIPDAAEIDLVFRRTPKDTCLRSYVIDACVRSLIYHGRKEPARNSVQLMSRDAIATALREHPDLCSGFLTRLSGIGSDNHHLLLKEPEQFDRICTYHVHWPTGSPTHPSGWATPCWARGFLFTDNYPPPSRIHSRMGSRRTSTDDVRNKHDPVGNDRVPTRRHIHKPSYQAFQEEDYGMVDEYCDGGDSSDETQGS